MTLHEKISGELRKRLNAMRPGERFPSEPELCREFGVARMTVNKVVTELVRDGRLVRERGRGSFVAETSREHKVINYLLPCAGYLADPRTPFLRKIAFGIAEEARQPLKSVNEVLMVELEDDDVAREYKVPVRTVKNLDALIK